MHKITLIYNLPIYHENFLYFADEKSSFGLKTESHVMSSNEIIQVIDSSTDFSIANSYNTPWTQNNFSCDLVSSKYDASYQHDTSSQLLSNVSEANSNQPE